MTLYFPSGKQNIFGGQADTWADSTRSHQIPLRASNGYFCHLLMLILQNFPKLLTELHMCELFDLICMLPRLLPEVRILTSTDIIISSDVFRCCLLLYCVETAPWMISKPAVAPFLVFCLLFLQSNFLCLSLKAQSCDLQITGLKVPCLLCSHNNVIERGNAEAQVSDKMAKGQVMSFKPSVLSD